MPDRQPWLLKTPREVKGAGFVEAFELKEEEIPEEAWKRYPYAIPCVKGMGRLELHPAVTFLIGENGSGKSTLLEAMAVRLGFSAEGGSRNYQFSSRDTHSGLYEHLRCSRRPGREQDHFFLRAESFYPLMSKVEEYETADPFHVPYTSWGGNTPHERSHGEAFLTLLTRRMGGNGLYLFDEPEAALSPKRQMSALVRIHDLVMDHSQFIIATHSPILLAYPHSLIYECGEHGIRAVKYEDTEIFRTTRDFLMHHERMVAKLLEEQEHDEECEPSQEGKKPFRRRRGK
ncbi:AAA family ATPase [Roseimicrobium gellanilyticum]|nr:AAA family ATPase [Roseimicrobium gellanilyticum]